MRRTVTRDGTGGRVKRAALVGFVLAACSPDIAQTPPPSGNVVVVQFDLGQTVPVVPIPNDLAKSATTGLLAIPPTPGESAAQREFETSYLEALSGYPYETTAQVNVCLTPAVPAKGTTAVCPTATSGSLDPSTVNAQTVLGFDLGPAGMPSGAPTPVMLTPSYVAATDSIVVSPPGGAWTRAHTYAIALVGGATGLKGASGEKVLGSQYWALVSSPTSLVTCQDLSSADCKPAVDILPSTQTDPALRLKDQTAKAIELEGLRRSYAPLLDALEAAGTPRASVPIAWTFSIVDAGEVTFDPANNVVPFPNDVLRVPAQGTTPAHLILPNPKTFLPLTAADCMAPTDPTIALTCGLNTLDGFSTLAPPISESSYTAGALAQGSIDPTSLSPSTVGLVPLASQAPMGERTSPSVSPCLNCLSSPDAMGNPQTSPQQLQWKLNAPLDEQTTYLAYVTGGVKDVQGKAVIANPAFALLRLTNPLFNGMHTTVNLITDAQAAQLEPLRSALAPALDGLQKAGVPRTSLTLAFAFTTQSEATILDQLNGYVHNPQLDALLPSDPLYVTDATTDYQTGATVEGVPFGAVGKVLIGAFITPVIVTGPFGTLNPLGPAFNPVSFTLYLPATPPPASGYPLTVFGHDFTRSHLDSLAIANSLAQAGQATIAIDVLFHGERSSCTGVAATIGAPSDDAACADPTTQKCNEDPLIGRCVARTDSTRMACAPAAGDPTGDIACMVASQGRCVAADMKCEGGDFLRSPPTTPLAKLKGYPVITGWNLFSLTNFFATRDNLRQGVVDLAQLVRVIKGAGATSLSSQAGVSFDANRLGHAGQGLGSILGTLYDAVSPDTTNVALDTPGGALVQMILSAPSFANVKAQLIAAVGQLGIQPGTPQFDQFLGFAQWILDAADPVSMAYRLTHSIDVTQNGMTYPAPDPARKAFFQFIEGDETVPNLSSLALVASANRAFVPMPPAYGCTPPLYCYEFTEAGDMFDATTATPSTRHGFLLLPASGSRGQALTAKAQLQVATFLATGELPP